jgi:hypothetical protein
MESLKMQQRALNLGNQLVQELGLDPGVDTLSRWMAHYIAEQIATAENASGPNKAKATERCFRTIISLWEHRASLPSGCRPFEDFEPIFRALARLDPEEPRSFYHQFAPRSATKEGGKAEKETVQNWINFIFAIDETARVLIEFALNEATKKAATKKTKTFLKNAISGPAIGDIEAVRALLDRSLKDPTSYTEGVRIAAVKKIQHITEKLDKFRIVSEKIRQCFNAELEALQKSRKKP